MSNTDHLAKAKDYIARGDEYYAKAAEEIVAAMKENPSLTQAEVGSRVGKSQSWVSSVISARISQEPVEWHSGTNKRSEVTRTTLSTADDSTMQAIVAALPEEQRTKLVHAAVNVSRPPSGDREDERAILQSIQDAPKHDLSAQAAKLVLVASQIELLLADGAEFQRMDAKNLQRLDRDLGRVKDTAERLQEQIGAQSKVRRIA